MTDEYRSIVGRLHFILADLTSLVTREHWPDSINDAFEAYTEVTERDIGQPQRINTSDPRTAWFPQRVMFSSTTYCPAG